MFQRFFISALALSVFSLSAFGANVAYVNNGGGNIDYLSAFGHTVTAINDPSPLTLLDLAGFDAVVVTSNSPFSDSTGIGNTLAAFADNGGGVVMTEFVFQGVWALGGALMGAGYSPLTIDPSSGGYSDLRTLGTINVPSSPLLAGVNTANVANQFAADSALNPGATLVASWNDGRPAIAYRSLGNSSIVALNLFPDVGWTNEDTQRLVANAVTFSLDGASSPVPEPATMAMALAGLAAICVRRIRRA